MKLMGGTGYDLDGTLEPGKPVPADCAAVISGRTFREWDDRCERIADQVPIFIRGVGALGDRQAAGEFKVRMIRSLGLSAFVEDDPLQAQIIRDGCPGVTVREP